MSSPAIRTAGIAVLISLVLASGAIAREYPTSSDDKKKDYFQGPQRSLVLDGSNVHNVGELHMHIGNWGEFGSRPGTLALYADQPSAQWPGGSGVEYLFTAGIWVGALINGVPSVSTAAFEQEFRPTRDPIDILYRTAEGARGGNRLPSGSADDDNDGAIDEDWLNGRDDDGDGAIDEDFAAVSKQMFACWYTDDQEDAITQFPEHRPLHIMVRQESYQWEEDRYDDFVGIEFEICNIGSEFLEDIYIGFFADPDCGPRDRDGYAQDDATARAFIPAVCTDLGPVQIDLAFAYDADGDEGATPGYFGVMFLGHSTDPTGEVAPRRVGLSGLAFFSGLQPFEEGGDPRNDFERYELLSQEIIERNQTVGRDYRMLVSAGPFSELAPGECLTFQVAFVAGPGFDDVDAAIANAASAQLTYDGAWFDLDNDRDGPTGYRGRETPVVGPAENISVDTCQADTRVPVPFIPKNEVLWVNNDCARELYFKFQCGYTDEDTTLYMTGVDGKETQLHWIVGTAPPPPSMRIDDHSADGLVLYWDNFSEVIPDVKTQEFDFEGYRVWRADNWDRPLGTNISTGPSAGLWKLLFEADLVNGLGNDTGLDQYRYEPLMHSLDPQLRADYILTMKEYLKEFGSAPPCPPGVTDAECDTLRSLAENDLGLPGGRRYYRYVDESMHLGRPYFYAVTALDHTDDGHGNLGTGKTGDPASNFRFVEPQTPAQQPWAYREGDIYVVPNPATTESMAAWTLNPNNDDPTGIKVEFRNLPLAAGRIKVFSLAGDLIQELRFDGSNGAGTVRWDLVSRSGQDVTSGVYLYTVEPDDEHFDRFVGKFVVIR